MDKTTLVRTLVMSEKSHSLVKIKVVDHEKPIVGAVHKVLNQIIIFKTAAAEPMTVMVDKIESVNTPTASLLDQVLQNISKTLHLPFRRN